MKKEKGYLFIQTIAQGGVLAAEYCWAAGSCY